MDGVLRFDARPNVGHADQDIPCALRDRSRQAGGGGVRESDGEHGFVAAAPAAKASGIEQAQIECRVLLFAGVGKGDAYPFSVGGHRKGDFHIALILRAIDGAFKDEFGCRGLQGGGSLLGASAITDDTAKGMKKPSSRARQLRPEVKILMHAKVIVRTNMEHGRARAIISSAVNRFGALQKKFPHPVGRLSRMRDSV